MNAPCTHYPTAQEAALAAVEWLANAPPGQRMFVVELGVTTDNWSKGTGWWALTPTQWDAVERDWPGLELVPEGEAWAEIAWVIMSAHITPGQRKVFTVGHVAACGPLPGHEH